MQEKIIRNGIQMRKVWDNEKLIGEVRRSDAMLMRITIVARDGIKYINLHDFYKKKSDPDGKWYPTMAGIAIPYVVPIDNGTSRLEPHKEIMQFINKALSELPEFPLEDEEHAVYTPIKPRR